MPSTLLLIPALKSAYPQFHFKAGSEYSWAPDLNTVFYIIDGMRNDAQLLHELSHAILGHSDYTRDIELLAMERAAWDMAMSLAAQFDVAVTYDGIQSALDSYREWLHARSTCPYCQAIGLQKRQNSYTCLACRQSWNVNEARMCALRRTHSKPI